jgi:hypothetical protein
MQQQQTQSQSQQTQTQTQTQTQAAHPQHAPAASSSARRDAHGSNAAHGHQAFSAPQHGLMSTPLSTLPAIHTVRVLPFFRSLPGLAVLALLAYTLIGSLFFPFLVASTIVLLNALNTTFIAKVAFRYSRATREMKKNLAGIDSHRTRILQDLGLWVPDDLLYPVPGAYPGTSAHSIGYGGSYFGSLASIASASCSSELLHHAASDEDGIKDAVRHANAHTHFFHDHIPEAAGTHHLFSHHLDYGVLASPALHALAIQRAMERVDRSAGTSPAVLSPVLGYASGLDDEDVEEQDEDLDDEDDEDAMALEEGGDAILSSSPEEMAALPAAAVPMGVPPIPLPLSRVLRGRGSKEGIKDAAASAPGEWNTAMGVVASTPSSVASFTPSHSHSGSVSSIASFSLLPPPSAVVAAPAPATNPSTPMLSPSSAAIPLLAQSAHGQAGFVHAIVITNYNEDVSLLSFTLSELAAHSVARVRYHVILAMEARERGCEPKALHLLSLFSHSFLRLSYTIHPVDSIPGAFPSKAANYSYVIRTLVRVYPSPGMWDRIMVTVMDADAIPLDNYFLEVEARHYRKLERDRMRGGDGQRVGTWSGYSAPAVFGRMKDERVEHPGVVQICDLMAAGKPSLSVFLFIIISLFFFFFVWLRGGRSCCRPG